MKTLFEIGNELQAVLASVDGGGEVDPALDAFFETLQVAEAIKMDNYANLIFTLENEASTANEQAELWDKKRKARLAKIEHLKCRMRQHLQTTGRTEIKTANGLKIKLQQAGKAPVIVDEFMQIPEIYTRTKVDTDKEKIRKALESGASLPFAKFGERTTILKIS